MSISQTMEGMMGHYIGLNVSLRRSSICVVNDAGSVLSEGTVDSEPEAISRFLRHRNGRNLALAVY